MDGGGRLLRSLGEAGHGLFPEARLRFAGPFATLAATPTQPAPARRIPRSGRSRAKPGVWTRHGFGTALVLVLFGGIGLSGAVRGGQYGAFVDDNGAIGDIVAKAVGFSLETVTINGLKELRPNEILQGGGVGPKNSLALLDPVALRDKLMAIPLVKDASVRKLFPHGLTITVSERDPVALWQKNGQISLIATDGVPIDTVRDDRFNGLPFVVGEGANTRFGEFQAMLVAAGDLRDKIRAGILVGERRWTLKMDSGVQVELPETGAADALKRLADIERQARILEKDVISLDLRIPGRIIARLSEDAAAQRAEALAKRPKAKAAAT